MNRGKQWESVLEKRHRVYQGQGVAAVYRAHPEAIVVRKGTGGRFAGRWKADGPCDFFGVISGGQAVVFDAKDCGGDRWNIGELKKHQAQQLADWHDLGAHAFVALRIGGEGWVLPWADLCWRWERRSAGKAKKGEASVTTQGLAQWAIRMPSPGDWLPCMDRMPGGR